MEVSRVTTTPAHASLAKATGPSSSVTPAKSISTVSTNEIAKWPKAAAALQASSLGSSSGPVGADTRISPGEVGSK